VIGLTLDGAGAGNIIADNGYEGVILYSTNTIGNSIRGNSIVSNGALGINLVGAEQSPKLSGAHASRRLHQQHGGRRHDQQRV
jgi:cytoskeletal protein CcmA (bactofilin family)